MALSNQSDFMRYFGLRQVILYDSRDGNNNRVAVNNRNGINCRDAKNHSSDARNGGNTNSRREVISSIGGSNIRATSHARDITALTTSTAPGSTAAQETTGCQQQGRQFDIVVFDDTLYLFTIFLASLLLLLTLLSLTSLLLLTLKALA